MENNNDSVKFCMKTWHVASAHLLKANFAWADVQQGRSTHEEIIEKDAYNLDTDL